MSELGTVTTNEAAPTPGARATFFGTAFHKVTGRNQVAIPKHLKRAIDEAREGQLLLMRWQNEAFLRLYTKKQFDLKLDEIKARTDLAPEQKAVAVDYMARLAEPVEPDSQGRFVIPAKWIEALSIKDEVAFCGAFTFVKIWPAELQREQDRTAQEQLKAVAEQVTSVLNM